MKTCILVVLICISPYYGVVKSHYLNQGQGSNQTQIFAGGCNCGFGSGSPPASTAPSVRKSTNSVILPPTTGAPTVMKPMIKCGTRAPIGHIVGGSKAQPKIWPWQIGIKSCPTCMYFCGGTIVAKRWVITAAHCVENYVASNLYIEAGVTNQEKVTEHRQSFNCTAIYKHQSYGINAPYDEDIAVLQLNHDVVFNDHVRPLCLNSKALSTPQTCSVTGFGKTSETGRRSGHLMQADVPIVARKVCVKAYNRTVPPRQVTRNMLCAGYATGLTDACGGDSGGPLTCWDQMKQHYILGGIVSWGVGCARKHSYGVYTDVEHLASWITNITGNKRATTCVDYYNYQTCYSLWYRGQCPYYGSYCRKTCGVCKVQPTVMITKPAISANCRNLKAKSQCDNWVVSKYCTQTFAAWMKTNCASSCGYCVCKDNNNQCAYWAKNNECQKNPKYMLLQCQKSCNVCRPKSTTKPVTKPKPTPKPTKKATPKPTTKPTTVARRTCGHSSTAGSRIVGGEFVQPGEWPWYAAIRACLNCTDIPFCGGTLINNKWVVTAAHCLAGLAASEIYVLLGETNVIHKSRHEVIRKVQKMYLHPDYAIAARYDYDIALLELQGNVNFTHYIQPACLPHLKPKLPAGMNCTVTGFGRTTETGLKSTRLKQAKVPLVSQTQCKKVVGDTGHLRITSNMLCAGHVKGGIDACQGDSGGPLVCKSDDGSYELAGVVSWGKGCARANQYGVYADMQVLRGWVENVIAGQILSRSG